MKRYCFEKPELVELCQRCEHEDCDGERGCKTYQNLKNKLEKEARDARRKQTQECKAAEQAAPEDVPRVSIMIEEMPVVQNDASFGDDFELGEILKRCNAAIIALEALDTAPGSARVFPAQKVHEMLEFLRAARMETYSTLIDWDKIAEGLKRGKQNGTAGKKNASKA